MMAFIDLSQLTPTDEMKGEDVEETELLQAMLCRAEQYLRSFDWCPPICQRYLGFGVGGVVAVFLFRLQAPVNLTDEWLWVIDGDLPSAYLVVDGARTPAAALALYCDMMDGWASAVARGSSLDSVFPVKADATREHADMLMSRITFLRERILPAL